MEARAQVRNPEPGRLFLPPCSILIQKSVCLTSQIPPLLKAAEALLAHTKGLEALDTAIYAVELYMKAVDEAPTKAEATRLRRKLHHLMTYGEKLKKTIDPRLIAEHQILRDASRLHGSHFTPWREEPLAEEFSLASSGELFM